MPTTVEELKGLRVKDLKRFLGIAALNVSGCFDRESLMQLLEPEGVAERVLEALAARAESSKPKVFTIPLVVEENSYLAVDLKLGSNSTVARFMIDTSTPFTTILNSWAQSLGGKLVDSHRVTLGSAYLGDLDCGQFIAVPVEMSLPPDCCGVISLDFLSRFDWELDVPNAQIKVATLPADASAPVPFDIDGLRMVPLEFQKATNPSMGGMEIKLLKAPLQIARQGTASASMLLESLGNFSVTCDAYFLFASVSACSTEVASALALGGEDYPGRGKQIKTPTGAVQTFQDYSLSLSIGDGPAGPVQVDAQLCVDHPGLQKLGFAPGSRTALLGLDVLGRSRMVFSPRMKCLWMTSA